MTYEKIFSTVKKAFQKADKKNFTSDFAFQFNITGEGEGIFYATYKNGTLEVEPYDYKDRDVIFTSDAATLIAVSEGKLEPVTAMNEGKLFVDGNNELAKSLMFLVSKPAKKAAAAKKAVPNKKAAAPKAEKKATAKTEAKSTVKAEAKPAAKAEIKPVAKAEVKAPAKAEAKPATKEAKPATALKK